METEEIRCSIEVNNKESSYYRYRDCKYKAKYKVYWKYSEFGASNRASLVCEKHKKQFEKLYLKKEIYIIKIEKL